MLVYFIYYHKIYTNLLYKVKNLSKLRHTNRPFRVPFIVKRNINKNTDAVLDHNCIKLVYAVLLEWFCSHFLLLLQRAWALWGGQHMTVVISGWAVCLCDKLCIGYYFSSRSVQCRKPWPTVWAHHEVLLMTLQEAEKSQDVRRKSWIAWCVLQIEWAQLWLPPFQKEVNPA